MECPKCGKKTLFDFITCPQCGAEPWPGHTPSNQLPILTQPLSTTRTTGTQILRIVALLELIGSILTAIFYWRLGSIFIFYGFVALFIGIVSCAVIIVVASMAENLAAIRENTRKLLESTSITPGKVEK